MGKHFRDEVAAEAVIDAEASIGRRQFVTAVAGGLGALLGINTLSMLKDDNDSMGYGSNVYGGKRP